MSGDEMNDELVKSNLKFAVGNIKLAMEQEILVRRKWQERAQRWEGDNYILREALKEVMGWIDGGSDFTDDPIWDETRERVNSILKNDK